MLTIKVFNADEKMYLGTITKTAEVALSKGFRFFLFNDIVYLIAQNENYYDTGLKKDDLIVEV